MTSETNSAFWPATVDGAIVWKLPDGHKWHKNVTYSPKSPFDATDRVVSATAIEGSQVIFSNTASMGKFPKIN